MTADATHSLATLSKSCSNEEEELSWTSSSMSLSPDHPMYQQQRTSSNHKQQIVSGEKSAGNKEVQVSSSSSSPSNPVMVQLTALNRDELTTEVLLTELEKNKGSANHDDDTDERKKAPEQTRADQSEVSSFNSGFGPTDSGDGELMVDASARAVENALSPRRNEHAEEAKKYYDACDPPHGVEASASRKLMEVLLSPKNGTETTRDMLSVQASSSIDTVRTSNNSGRITIVEEDDDFEFETGLPLSRKNSEASSLSHLLSPSFFPDTDEAESSPWPLQQEQSLTDESPGEVTTRSSWPLERKQQDLMAVEFSELLTQQFHHRRLPSTIAEEENSTIPDDDLDGMRPQKPIKIFTQPGYSSDQATTQYSRTTSNRLSSSSRWSSYDNLQQFESSKLDRKRELTQFHLDTRPSAATRDEIETSPLLGLTHSRTLSKKMAQPEPKGSFTPLYTSTKVYAFISKYLLKQHYAPFAAATWIGFWALLLVTCANYVLTPMRDAIALQVGVAHIPKLTLASTLLAFCSSVPIGWLFEAPDPSRRRLWKRMGLTRGETQGTSLALFYRCFAFILLSYACSFQFIEFLKFLGTTTSQLQVKDDTHVTSFLENQVQSWWPLLQQTATSLLPPPVWSYLAQSVYVAFFLVVHLMKLHSISLVWGVTSEAMEYEEVARKKCHAESHKTRLQRMALVGFGGTVGGIVGSGLASSLARVLKLPGLLLVSAVLFEVSAELAIELGRIMEKYWEEQQLFQSSNDLTSLDSSMKRSVSLGSMKRVASGNSLNNVRSATDLHSTASKSSVAPAEQPVNDDSFKQRLVRGATTILRSRLLMAIFTYNALYASTTVLLSFQRAALVANRNSSTSIQADTAFLANINMASSVAIFMLQASGLGSTLASFCGPRGTLALMPFIRFAGVVALAWWHHISSGKPPNLLIFLVVDECTKIMNLAVAKPVRESLWRGLSNEARYEAKPIVDTLANRWGGGSAAFLVSFINKTMDLWGVTADSPESVRTILGFPPILVLCIVISAWWAGVSADLGRIRSSIDLELKKRL